MVAVRVAPGEVVDVALSGEYTNDQRVVVSWEDGDDPSAAADIAARLAAEHGHRLTDTTVTTTTSISWVTRTAGPSAA